MNARTLKAKSCKSCKSWFIPARPLQIACSPECAHAYVEAKKAKEKAKAERLERAETRRKLDAMRTQPELVRIAQQAFNAYIRARDAGKLCISCGTPLSSQPNTYDAGHYRSVGSAPNVRFSEDNCHGQCKYCNHHLSGNHVHYRKGLIARIGLPSVELLEADNTPRKYTREGLIEIARHYRAETSRIEKERNA